MVRVPMGRLLIGNSVLQRSVLAVALLFCAPAQVLASEIVGVRSSPPSANEISEANSPAHRATAPRSATIRSNQSSEAASPNAKKPVQSNTLRTNSTPAQPNATRNNSNARAPITNTQITAPIKSKANESASFASEAEMALALNIPLEPKNAQDAQFVTNDMRPIDVAPWQKIGSPYQVNGVWYIPAHEPNYNETGEASWYGDKFNGRQTANGEIFDMNAVTVAHPTLPIPSLVEVINLENGRSIVARVNDRGPFANNRLIDVSQRGAELLGFKEKGRARVRVRYVGQAPQQIINANSAQPIGQTAAKEAQIPAQNSAPKAEILAVNAIAAPNNETKTTPKQINSPPNITGGTFVQIGAFSSLANAERALEQNAGYGPGKIIPVQNGTTSVYRVMIGPFDATDAALKAEEAKSNGINGARVVANIS